MGDYAAKMPETQAEFESRTARMVAALLTGGLSEAEAAMADQIEVTKRALVEEHGSLAAETGSTEGVKAWAHSHLFGLDFSGVKSLEEIETQVRALALLAENLL